MRILGITLGLAFFVLLLLGSGVVVQAQSRETEVKWEKYDTDENGVEYYYDKRSLSFPKTDILRVWRQRVFPTGASYREIITLDEVDCNKQKYRTLEMRVTARDGSVQGFKKVSEWSYIYVGMPEDYFLQDHCK